MSLKKTGLQKRIQRRRKVEGHFPEPLSINELIIPEEFKTFTINGNTEPFLLSDVTSDSKRIIIFASQHMLDQLGNSKIWMCDGTFKVVPRIFYQLYTIHVVREDFLFPCVYVMMPDKAQSTYERVFPILKDKRPDCDPENVTLDFEKSAINAFMTVYPDANINGCFFHLSQSIWRKIQITGLSNSYISDANCRLYCKMLAALAFLNPDEVIDAFEELNEDLERLQLDEEMQILYDYFEDTYIGRRQRRGRRIPLFPIELWNVRERTQNGRTRTNNKLEGWHRAIQGMYDTAHPTVWRSFQGIIKEEAL